MAVAYLFILLIVCPEKVICMVQPIDDLLRGEQEQRHFMQQVRGQQAVLAQELSRKLLNSYCNTELEALKTRSQEERRFGKELLKQEFQDDVEEAVIGYVDWLATDFIRRYENNNTFDPRTLPSDKEIPYNRIQEKYGASPGLVYLVSCEMHKQETIPLIGTVQGTSIVPDKETLLKWRDLFDWSEEEKK